MHIYDYLLLTIGISTTLLAVGIFTAPTLSVLASIITVLLVATALFVVSPTDYT